MLIRNDSGVVPTLNWTWTRLSTTTTIPTEKDGLDYPGMGQPGWTILDSVGIFAEPEETETGRLYGMVNYARFDSISRPNLIPKIEPGSEFRRSFSRSNSSVVGVTRLGTSWTTGTFRTSPTTWAPARCGRRNPPVPIGGNRALIRSGLSCRERLAIPTRRRRSQSTALNRIKRFRTARSWPTRSVRRTSCSATTTRMASSMPPTIPSGATPWGQPVPNPPPGRRYESRLLSEQPGLRPLEEQLRAQTGWRRLACRSGVLLAVVVRSVVRFLSVDDRAVRARVRD